VLHVHVQGQYQPHRKTWQREGYRSGLKCYAYMQYYEKMHELAMFAGSVRVCSRKQDMKAEVEPRWGSGVSELISEQRPFQLTREDSR
jgi:hypothetical protein